MTDSLLKKTINNLISDFLRQLRKEVALWMRTAPKDSIVHGYDLSHLDSAAGNRHVIFLSYVKMSYICSNEDE